MTPSQPAGRIHLGTCAWSFEEWRGPFYPPGLPHKRWLEFYARYFKAVEVDTTFFHLPARHVIAHWREQTPEDFVFTIKMPRTISHQARLRDCRPELELFVESIRGLGPKLGCVLVQLPLSFSPRHDELALREFVRILPRDVRFAIEFRHMDWHLPRIVHLFEKHGICWVWNDISPLGNQRQAAFEFLPQTTDFVYVRLLGDLRTEFRQDGQRAFPSGKQLWSRAPSIENWGFKLARHMKQSRDIYLFATNHFEGMAPLSCQRLAAVCGLSLALPEPEPLRQLSLDYS